MKLSKYLEKDSMELSLKGETKEEVLREMVNLLPLEDEVAREQIYESIMAHERFESTGIGNGVAVPNALNPVCDRLMMAFAITESTVRYQARDGKPVRILFMVVSNNAFKVEHVKLLARIVRLVKHGNLNDKLMNCTERAEVVKLISLEDEKHPI